VSDPAASDALDLDLDMVAGEPDSAFEDFFDPEEFETRAWLEDQHYWHLYRRDVILDVLRAAGVGGGSSVLELGCGAGTVATYLNENGLRVDYGDVHRQALRFARERARARLPAGQSRRFMRVDITRHLPPGDYDGVLLLDVLEHLPDPHSVMRAVHALVTRSAAPRPFVLFTVPAFQMLWSPFDDRERHKRRYTVATARALATETGFTVERATYFFFPLFFAAAGVKALRKAGALVRGPTRPQEFGDMVETTNHPALNAAMLRLLSAERRWLANRNLPLGTSALVLARPAR
jgi:SAM-dependent methyltransferase